MIFIMLKWLSYAHCGYDDIRKAEVVMLIVKFIRVKLSGWNTILKTSRGSGESR